MKASSLKSATGEVSASQSVPNAPNHDHQSGSALDSEGEKAKRPSSSMSRASSSSSTSTVTSTSTQPPTLTGTALPPRKTVSLLSSASLPVLSSRALSSGGLDLRTSIVTIAVIDPKPKPPCIDKLEALMTSAKAQGMCITKLFGKFVPLPTAAAEDGAAGAAATADSSAGGDKDSLPQVALERNGQSSSRPSSRASARTLSRSTSGRHTLAGRRTESGEFEHASAAGESISHSLPGTSSHPSSGTLHSLSPRRSNLRSPPKRSLSSGHGLRSVSVVNSAPTGPAAPVMVEVCAISRSALAAGLTALASHKDRDMQFGEEEVQLIMQYLDEDSSGEIELWEFAAFCLRIPSVTWKAERSRRGVRSCNDEEMIVKAAKAIHAEMLLGLYHSGPSQMSLDTAAIDEETEHSSRTHTPPPQPVSVDEREVVEVGTLLKQGSKLFWRTREHVEYAIYENSSRGLLSLFTYHVELNLVFPPLLINLRKLPVVAVRDGITTRLADLERKKKEETNAGLFDLDEDTKRLLLEQARTEVICDFLEARLQIPAGRADHSIAVVADTTSSSTSNIYRSAPAEDKESSTTHLQPPGPYYLLPDHAANSKYGGDHHHKGGSGSGDITLSQEECAALVTRHQPYLVALHGDKFIWADLVFASDLGKGVRLEPEHKFRNGHEPIDRKLRGFQSFSELNERYQQDRAQSNLFTLKAVATSAQAVGILAACGAGLRTTGQCEGGAGPVNELLDLSWKTHCRAHTFTAGQFKSPAELMMLSQPLVIEGDGTRSPSWSPRSPRRLEPLTANTTPATAYPSAIC